MEKPRNSIAVTDREKNLGKSASLSKHLSLVDEDLISRLTTLASDI